MRSNTSTALRPPVGHLLDKQPGITGADRPREAPEQRQHSILGWLTPLADTPGKAASVNGRAYLGRDQAARPNPASHWNLAGAANREGPPYCGGAPLAWGGKTQPAATAGAGTGPAQ